MSDSKEISNGWIKAIFENLLDYIQPTKFIVESTEYDDKYKTPVLTAGKSFIIGHTNETNGVFNKIPVIIFDDFTTATKFVNFPFKVKSSAMKILSPVSKLVNIKYVFCYMQTLRINADTHKRYWISHYSKLPVPLPPLPEQHRIVAKIEELFSSLDKGIESLKTAQQQLKVYRQSVLKWAFKGKLTEAFRNINNQLKDVSSILSDIRKNRENWFKKNGKKLKLIAEIDSHDLPELPKKWCWVKIVETVLNTADDIVDGPFGSNLKNSDYVDGAPVPVIGISNIEEGFDKKIRYITNEKFETIKRSAVYPGDIIVAKIGSTYGKTGIYPEWMPIGVIPANLLRIRPAEHYSKKLLVHYLQSIVFKKRLDKIMKSTAQPAFNVSMFKDLPIPFMSLDEQNKLVDEIEARLSVCDKIEESIEQSLKQSESLRQSILKKAFGGKLVPQDPNDEPASVLLARIKAEKEKNKPENPPHRQAGKTKTKKAKS